MITHRQEGEGGTTDEWIWGGSSYVDALERIDGRWKITQRGDHVERVPTKSAGERYPSSDDPDVQPLVDRAEIHDVVTATALATDRGDWELYGRCFASTEGTAEHLDALRTQHDHWHSTCHFMNNQLIDVAPERAGARRRPRGGRDLSLRHGEGVGRDASDTVERRRVPLRRRPRPRRGTLADRAPSR